MTNSQTGRRSPLLEKGTSHGGGMQPHQEAAHPDDRRASTRWHELVSELAKPALSHSNSHSLKEPEHDNSTAANQNLPPQSADCDSRSVRATLEKAVQAAKADSQWSASGLPESLQRTVQLCSSEGPTAAKTAALGLLDFHQIVKNTKLRSPKTPSPPMSPERDDDVQSSKPGHTAAAPSGTSRHAPTSDSNGRLVTSGSRNQGNVNQSRQDVIGQLSPEGADQPARAIFREGHAQAGSEDRKQLLDSQDNTRPAQTARQGKEAASPIALQVATLMREHLRSIQASGILPPVSLELPAVPQLQLDSKVGPPRSIPVGVQPASTGQQIAVINSCPLLVIPSALPLPPEPSLYRPIRPNRTISAPSESAQRPSHPIRCISAPSSLPADLHPLRPGNVISSGVPQAHPRYREASRLTPSPISKPGLPATKVAAEVKVRVVHAPARSMHDGKPEGEPVRRLPSAPAAPTSNKTDEPLARPAPDSKPLSPLHLGGRSAGGQAPDSAEKLQSGGGRAERTQLLSSRSSASPFAQSKSSKHAEGNQARERSPTPEDDQSPKRRKLDMQKALSLNTVLRCVDKHNGQDEGFDTHVGEAPTTIEDMADVDGEQPEARQPLPTIKSAPTQISSSMAPEPLARAGRSSTSPPLLHQMVRQVCEAVGETWRTSLQQHIQSSLNALGPGPQPLNAGPSPGPPPASSPQSAAVGPSGLPAGTLSIYQGSANGPEPAPQQHSASSPGQLGEGNSLPQDAAAAAVGRGFHLGDMPPCTSLAAASKTALWSGKVKHKHGGSIVELFHMTALIPEQYLERLPPTLFASELANRSSVKLRQQVFVMRCKLGFLSDRQLHKLHMLAHLKLVAICHLQHVTITLVPYYNSENGFKVVGFMLADD